MSEDVLVPRHALDAPRTCGRFHDQHDGTTSDCETDADYYLVPRKLAERETAGRCQKCPTLVGEDHQHFDAALLEIPGVGRKGAKRLTQAGYETPADCAGISVEELVALGFEPDNAMLAADPAVAATDGGETA